MSPDIRSVSLKLLPCVDADSRIGAQTRVFARSDQISETTITTMTPVEAGAGLMTSVDLGGHTEEAANLGLLRRKRSFYAFAFGSEADPTMESS